MKQAFLLFCSLLLVTTTTLQARRTPQLAADSLYGVVRISVCNVREEGRFTSGMSTQGLLGMPVRVLQYNGWFEVRLPDEYTGWVHRLVITPMNKEQYEAWEKAAKVVVTALYSFVYTEADEHSQTVSDVVAGDRLKWEATEGEFYRVSYPDGRQGYIARSCAEKENDWRTSRKKNAASILQTARTLLGIPYLWGGTSTKGMDCSGFVRTVLAMHDIAIPRDTWQQARIGPHIQIAADFSNLHPGDLLFFGEPAADGKPERVSHVAFYLGNKRFIHALGDVHIGSFDPHNTAEYDAFNTHRLLFAIPFK